MHTTQDTDHSHRTGGPKIGGIIHRRSMHDDAQVDANSLVLSMEEMSLNS